jgi:hypothetical protein
MSSLTKCYRGEEGISQSTSDNFEFLILSFGEIVKTNFSRKGAEALRKKHMILEG